METPSGTVGMQVCNCAQCTGWVEPRRGDPYAAPSPCELANRIDTAVTAGRAVGEALGAQRERDAWATAALRLRRSFMERADAASRRHHMTKAAEFDAQVDALRVLAATVGVDLDALSTDDGAAPGG